MEIFGLLTVIQVIWLFTMVLAKKCFIGQAIKDEKAIFVANTESVCDCTAIYPGGVTAYKSLKRPYKFLPMLEVPDLFNPDIDSVLSKMNCTVVCKDNKAACPGWAARGECDANPRYMLHNCKLSCNLCVGEPGTTLQPSTAGAHTTVEPATTHATAEPTTAAAAAPTTAAAAHTTAAAATTISLEECVQPAAKSLGMQDGTIKDAQITASSKYEEDYEGYEARLGNSDYWATGEDDSDPWIQVDLLTDVTITKIFTQGAGSTNEWVKKFNIAYKASDDEEMSYILKHLDERNDDRKDFDGNKDKNTVKYNDFPKPINARFLRIIPIDWHTWVGLRFELAGYIPCTLDCPLGMNDKSIPDESITALYYYRNSYNYQPRWARLNSPDGVYKMWVAEARSTLPWIQADIGYQTLVWGLETQGDGGNGESNDWVKTLKVSTYLSSTDDAETFISDGDGEDKIFDANTDQTSLVTIRFDAPVTAQIVRIYPLTKSATYWSMRFELLGCKQNNDE